MNKIKRLIDLFNEKGFLYTLKRAFVRLKNRRIKNYKNIRQLFLNKSGIEIGGPSGIFSPDAYLPIYDVISNLDGCNFSSETMWEGQISKGNTYKYFNDKTGYQYVSEATDLKNIEDNKYDFIISSNCLEHVANPLKAIKEWTRVLKPNGLILLVLPHKDYCFDHKRPISSFNHLLQDFNNNTGEDDLTHLDEILKLHDLSMDKDAGSFESFKQRSLKNFENRGLHQHVFDTNLLKKIFDYMNITTLITSEGEDGHIIFGQISNN